MITDLQTHPYVKRSTNRGLFHTSLTFSHTYIQYVCSECVHVHDYVNASYLPKKNNNDVTGKIVYNTTERLSLN